MGHKIRFVAVRGLYMIFGDGWMDNKIFVMNLQFSGRAGIDRSLQVHFIMGNQHLRYIPPVGPHIVRPPLYFE